MLLFYSFHFYLTWLFQNACSQALSSLIKNAVEALLYFYFRFLFYLLSVFTPIHLIVSFMTSIYAFVDFLICIMSHRPNFPTLSIFFFFLLYSLKIILLYSFLSILSISFSLQSVLEGKIVIKMILCNKILCWKGQRMGSCYRAI